MAEKPRLRALRYGEAGSVIEVPRGPLDTGEPASP